MGMRIRAYNLVKADARRVGNVGIIQESGDSRRGVGKAANAVLSWKSVQARGQIVINWRYWSVQQRRSATSTEATHLCEKKEPRNR